MRGELETAGDVVAGNLLRAVIEDVRAKIVAGDARLVGQFDVAACDACERTYGAAARSGVARPRAAESAARTRLSRSTRNCPDAQPAKRLLLLRPTCARADRHLSARCRADSRRDARPAGTRSGALQRAQAQGAHHGRGSSPQSPPRATKKRGFGARVLDLASCDECSDATYR